MTIAHLEKAEWHVAEGESRIAYHWKIVAALKRRSGDRDKLRTAQALLQTLELAQQFNVAYRDRLRAEIAESERATEAALP
jgi:hypothetical protein